MNVLQSNVDHVLQLDVAMATHVSVECVNQTVDLAIWCVGEAITANVENVSLLDVDPVMQSDAEEDTTVNVENVTQESINVIKLFSWI